MGQKRRHAKIGAMNETLSVILNRKSIREFLPKTIPEDAKADIIGATLRAPMAANLSLGTGRRCVY